jgi:hypothetical protein
VLDRWSADQLLQMVIGGNAACSAFFKSKGWTDESTDNHQAKYTSKAANDYKNHLEKEVARQRHHLTDSLLAPSPEWKPHSGPQLEGLDALEHEIRSKSPTTLPPSAQHNGSNNIAKQTQQTTSTASATSSIPSSSSLASSPAGAVSAQVSQLSIDGEADAVADRKSTPKAARQIIRKEPHHFHSNASQQSPSTAAATAASSHSSSSPAPADEDSDVVVIPSDVSAEELTESAASHPAAFLTTATRKPTSKSSKSSSSIGSSVRSSLTTKKKSSLSVSRSGGASSSRGGGGDVDDGGEDVFEVAMREAQAGRQAALSPQSVTEVGSVGAVPSSQSSRSSSAVNSGVGDNGCSNGGWKKDKTDDEKLKRYANATSISSTQFFSQDDDVSTQTEN